MSIKLKTLLKLILLFVSIILIISGIIYQIYFIKPPKYTIYFDSTGGSKVENISIYEGEIPTKPKDPIKKGYYFVGWYFNGKEYDFSIPINNDIYLMAEWGALKVNND